MIQIPSKELEQYLTDCGEPTLLSPCSGRWGSFGTKWHSCAMLSSRLTLALTGIIALLSVSCSVSRKASEISSEQVSGFKGFASRRNPSESERKSGRA